jgi:hypothetical protein
MEKSSKGIFYFLCNQMERLEGNAISVEELRAFSGATKQLNNLLRYELDRAKAIEKFSGIKIHEVETRRK